MKKSSVYFCFGFICFFFIALIAVSIFASQLIAMYSNYRHIPPETGKTILVAFYFCSVPAALALVCLLLLLRNIQKNMPFSKRNSFLMSLISWCCIVVTIVTAIAGFRYMPLFLISVAMLFLFLIIRVIRGCFHAALLLQEENDLTI